jgi:CheY-like chemotaxis protein
MLRRLIGEDIELVTVLEEQLGLVSADPGQVEQVIVNLAVNARDAMTEGGRLVIETANVDLGAGEAGRHVGVKPGRYVMVSLSDTGCGMTPETMARMFEPFFTTKEKGRGTGLGLATVYGIVKQSGGDISVHSEPGRGTTFKVYLPRVEYETGVVVPAVVPSDRAAGRETILLVEDDEALCMLARRILEARGYTVLEARNGEEALVLCERHEGPIDLVATDVVMPGMNGRMLVERLTAQRPAVRVLFMSGYTDDDMLRRGIVDPRMAFFQKPFTPEALANKVREVLDSPVPVVVPGLPPPGSPAPVSR